MSVYNLKKVKDGHYRVVNKEKLRNEKKILYYRSGLEQKFMLICDHSPNIIQWGYEDVVIPYQKSYESNKNFHRYIMDFWLKKKVNDTIKEYLVEIKPYDFLSPPKPQKRKTKKYIELVENWSTNKAKWEQADKYCKERNMIFAIITEKDLT